MVVVRTGFERGAVQRAARTCPVFEVVHSRDALRPQMRERLKEDGVDVGRTQEMVDRVGTRRR